MDNKKILVTKQGLKDLQDELETLLHVTKPEVLEELKAARAQGDLSENADYDAARDKQAQVESRIVELEQMIKNAEIIKEKTKSNIVSLGTVVEIKFLDTNETETYKIVGPVEADPLNGKLSNATPLAQAIIDREAGEIVEVQAQESYKVKILSIKAR